MSPAETAHPSTTQPEPSDSLGPVPPRRNAKTTRKTTIPPQPSIKRHTVRLIAATAIGVGVMFLLLMLAVKYAERDWSRKQQQARGTPRRSPAKESPAPAPTPRPEGWNYTPPPGATGRQLRRLDSDRYISSSWLILARALSDRDQPALVLAALRMAMAHGGESAAVRNDFGVFELQQRRMRQAQVHFRAAQQIEPGFPPALFNLALGAMAERNPVRASQLLSHYLARRPDDAAAYRLQAALLTQLDRPKEALLMLEKFLRNQPADQPLFLEAATLAARLGRQGNAIRYLETALNGNPLQNVVRAYQSSAFRDIRLSSDGAALSARLASRARVTYGAPVPAEEIQPLRATPHPEAIFR